MPVVDLHRWAAGVRLTGRRGFDPVSGEIARRRGTSPISGSTELLDPGLEKIREPTSGLETFPQSINDALGARRGSERRTVGVPSEASKICTNNGRGLGKILAKFVPLLEVDEQRAILGEKLRGGDEPHQLAAEGGGGLEDSGNARDPALAFRR
jgi:hypothetical protein